MAIPPLRTAVYVADGSKLPTEIPALPNVESKAPLGVNLTAVKYTSTSEPTASTVPSDCAAKSTISQGAFELPTGTRNVNGWFALKLKSWLPLASRRLITHLRVPKLVSVAPYPP